jgi:hypothetical protein
MLHYSGKFPSLKRINSGYGGKFLHKHPFPRGYIPYSNPPQTPLASPGTPPQSQHTTITQQKIKHFPWGKIFYFF